MTEKTDTTKVSRRMTIAGLGAAAVFGFTAGSASGETSSGQIGTPSNPYDAAYVSTVVFDDIDDPDNPEVGTVWFNSEYQIVNTL